MKCENNVMRRVATYHNVKKAIKKSQKRKKRILMGADYSIKKKLHKELP